MMHSVQGMQAEGEEDCLYSRVTRGVRTREGVDPPIVRGRDRDTALCTIALLMSSHACSCSCSPSSIVMTRLGREARTAFACIVK
jgi:hypothetical protein